MQEHQVSRFPILAEKLTEALDKPKQKKTRKHLRDGDRDLLKEAITAGGTNAVIAKRFDVSEATVTNVRKEMRRDMLSLHVPQREAVPEIPAEPAQKRITQSVTEVYDAIEHLHEEDKLRVLLAVAYLFGMSTNLS